MTIEKNFHVTAQSMCRKVTSSMTYIQYGCRSAFKIDGRPLKSGQPYCAGQYCQFVIPRVTTVSLHAYSAERVTEGVHGNSLVGTSAGASGMARAFARLTSRLILPSFRTCILDSASSIVNRVFIHSRRDGANLSVDTIFN